MASHLPLDTDSQLQADQRCLQPPCESLWLFQNRKAFKVRSPLVIMLSEILCLVIPQKKPKSHMLVLIPGDMGWLSGGRWSNLLESELLSLCFCDGAKLGPAL